MSSQQSNASAKKIVNYTEAIYFGVTNLFSELGRVNAAVSFDSAAIQTQLEMLIALVQGMDTRLAAAEKALQRLQSDNIPGLMEIAPAELVQMPGPIFMPELTADEYNSRARRYNNTVQRGNEALMPLRTAKNTLAVGFPSTLGHLVFLDGDVESQLKKAFNLSDEFYSLWTFIGANMETISLRATYSTPESLAEVRMDKLANRERDVAAAGPVTASTKRAAAAHNVMARAQNTISRQDLIPMHDDRNIPVHGCPSSVWALANQYRQWDVLYLLKEYGQSVKEKSGCLERLIIFFGRYEKDLAAGYGHGEGIHPPYWYM